MNDNNSSPLKKRKANDGRVTADGTHDVNTGNTNDGGGFLSSWFGYFSGQRVDVASSGPSLTENNTSQLNRMEQIMMRVEEKLATVSSLESRCEQLEAKCSSLENMLESTSQSTKEHIDKTLKYHEMLIRNQNWEYSAPVYTVNELALADYDDDEAEYIYETSQLLKRSTEALRGGNFPDESDVFTKDKGISLYVIVDDGYHLFGEDTNKELSPHWREFAAALKHFKPALEVLPDDCETFFTFGNNQLTEDMSRLMKEALFNMPFKKFCFEDSYHFHGGMSTIAKMMDNNTCLQKLEFDSIQDLDRNDIANLCSAIHRHPSLVDVSISDCFSNNLGDEMLHSLLRTDELKLEKLSMSGNRLLRFRTGINVCTLLADFLSTNPRLTELNLCNNSLNDSDAVLIAIALRSNTTLTYLNIDENRVGEAGAEALRRALCDETSLNSVADSNHSCSIDADYELSMGYHSHDENMKDREINRAEKIYRLLSSRNETSSNVQHFGNIDVKLLPNVLEAVQKYSISLNYRGSHTVEASSIVYEVMRKWDKARIFR